MTAGNHSGTRPEGAAFAVLACAAMLVLVGFPAGCAPRSTFVGRPYTLVVERLESGLARLVGEDRIMPFAKEYGEGQTVLRFIEGSSMDKAAHAFPLRVAVTVEPERGGSDSSILVEAVKHGMKSQKRDRDAEKRWGVVLAEMARAAKEVN